MRFSVKPHVITTSTLLNRVSVVYDMSIVVLIFECRYMTAHLV